MLLHFPCGSGQGSMPDPEDERVEHIVWWGVPFDLVLQAHSVTVAN